jgi:putative hydrolase of the HAD superfamily
MKVLLFDADGVVLKKGELFSEKFSREYNIPIEEVMKFFKGPFGACQEGTKDLRGELVPFLESWGWQGSVEDFMDYWFEDVVLDPELLDEIQGYREKGIKCYLASNNEHYRGRKIESVLGDKLDGYFFSADLKLKKGNPDYFRDVLEKLGVEASEVGFVDNEDKNVESAREAGIRAKLFTDGVFEELLSESVLQEFKHKIQ